MEHHAAAVDRLDGEADAVDRDGASDPDAWRCRRALDDELEAVVAAPDGRNPANLADDAREHVSRLAARSRLVDVRLEEEVRTDRSCGHPRERHGADEVAEQPSA